MIEPLYTHPESYPAVLPDTVLLYWNEVETYTFFLDFF